MRFRLTDFYSVLGVDRNSSFKKIKISFRRKAKLLHPDVTTESKEKAEESMRQLISAYRVLSNPAKRDVYDRELRGFEKKDSFNYRSFLVSRPDDMYLQSRLVFFDLLHGNYKAAMELYERLEYYPGFKLERFLEYGDFMDCTFLIAEEYERQREFVKAFLMFRKIYAYEMRRPYFRHFSEEVSDRLKHLVTTKMQKAVSRERFIEHIKDLLNLRFPERDKAIFCKKIAELYSHLGDRKWATEYLRQGLSHDRRLAGTKKLSEKIGFAEVTN